MPYFEVTIGKYEFTISAKDRKAAKLEAALQFMLKYPNARLNSPDDVFKQQKVTIKKV